jgi:hypothetical protein
MQRRRDCRETAIASFFPFSGVPSHCTNASVPLHITLKDTCGAVVVWETAVFAFVLGPWGFSVSDPGCGLSRQLNPSAPYL